MRRAACLWLFLASCALAQIPEADPVTVQLELPKDAVQPGSTFDAQLVFDIAAPWHIYGPTEKLSTPTKVSLTSSPGFSAGDPVFPSGEKYENKATVKVPVTVGKEVGGGEHAIEFSVSYQACTESTCKFPATQKVEGKLRVGGAAKATTGGTSEPPPKKPREHRKKGAAVGIEAALQQGLVNTLLVAFLWGLASCLTPCVFPVIPITIAYFGSGGEGTSWVRRAVNGAFYTAGIALFYAVLGLVAAALSANLGQALGNPWVVGVISVIFLALALSMFGLYQIRLPSSLVGNLQGKQRRGPFGALFMGAILSLIAAPCVGPFVASILAYASTAGNRMVSFFSLLSFGLGLGFPFFFLSIFANALSNLPRAGEWMVKVEHFFGFVMLAMILYFTRVFLSREVTLLLAGVICVLWGTYTGAFTALSKESGAGAHFGKAIGLLLAISGILSFTGGFADHLRLLPKAESGPWKTGFDSARAYAHDEHKPMIVDFTADW